ncbi:MAG TPA: hypothetical protein PLJ78_15190 [Anaerolineae bacterium]|nr:hypothetical protein [Anaerolineae bacterium]HQK15277.1 hypothetical protein [Anaerolineae bacterium]
MPVSTIVYDLQDGYIHHWLVVGPQSIPLTGVSGPLDVENKSQIAQRYHTPDSGVTRQPVEPGPLTEADFTLDGYIGRWAYTLCGEDHFVDCTAAYPTPHYVRAWAYTRIATPQARPVTLVLSAYGPVDVWINDAHCFQEATFGFHHATFIADLTEGSNTILVRFAQVGLGDCPHALALRVCDAPDDAHVEIPTLIEDITLRNRLERIFSTAYLDRDVFVWDEFVTVHWASREGTPEDMLIRLQTPAGRIYAESLAVATPGGKSPLVQAHQTPQGPLHSILMPPIRSYFDENVRIRRTLSMWSMGLAQYTEAPERPYIQRRDETLQHAVRCEGTLFGEIAKMALGMWQAVEPPVLLRVIERVNRREIGSALDLLGLLGMLRRWGNAPDFPKTVKASLRTCVLDFAYEVANDAPESEQILLNTCELLAGQMYARRRFKSSGQTGEWHAAKGKRRTLAWLRARADAGFSEWDSGRAFEAELTALAHLMDLVEDEAIWQMATVVLDKLLFTLALNSHRGIVGGTQGDADAAGILGGWLSPLGSVTRLLWGVGILNPHLAAAVSLACMEDYELPPLFQEIALTPPDALWNCEQHLLPDGGGVNKVTYRTPDYLLGSAQDYRPGAPGTREHIWQATLGPGAVVFTNHPASDGTTEAHAPGFWRGNGILPRVAQWKDVLIAVYNLPDDDWMGFTHAYFPLSAFDAYAIREDANGQAWAFARKGNAYLALTAARGLTLMTQEPGAYRELRSPGRRNVWLCHMGRAVLDGDFTTFQESVLALPVMFDDLAVTVTTLRQETLTFGWEGPLLRDGQSQPLAGFKHYDNPYCVVDLHAGQMEIKSDNYLMRLKFT